MEINNIQIFPIRQEGSLMAFGSFESGCLRISGIALHTKKDGGLRSVFPAKRVGSGYVYYCQPLNQETSEEVDTAFEEKAKEIGLFNL